MEHNVAIIYFTRKAREEVCFKKIHQNPHDSYHGLAYLINRTRNVLKQSGLPFFEIDSSTQQGNTPNEKLNAAFTSLFSIGYKKLIAIGNDCPVLKAIDLQEASEKLTDHGAVIGPDLSGGVYLMGFRKEAYKAESILKATWGKTSFCQEILSFYGETEVFALPRLTDLNRDISQLKKVLLKSRMHLMEGFLKMFTQINWIEKILFLHTELVSLTTITRGPPLAPDI